MLCLVEMHSLLVHLEQVDCFLCALSLQFSSRLCRSETGILRAHKGVSSRFRAEKIANDRVLKYQKITRNEWSVKQLESAH